MLLGDPGLPFQFLLVASGPSLLLSDLAAHFNTLFSFLRIYSIFMSTDLGACYMSLGMEF